jgi:hypothetical protein
MSMQRSIRRNIVRQRGQDWATYQKRKYGNAYGRITRTGRQKYGHNRRGPIIDKPAAQSIGLRMAARNAVANFLAKINRKTETRKREATA